MSASLGGNPLMLLLLSDIMLVAARCHDPQALTAHIRTCHTANMLSMQSMSDDRVHGQEIAA